MQYDFTGNNDILRFIKEAQEEGLLVILRVGPYICAERDMASQCGFSKKKLLKLKFDE